MELLPTDYLKMAHELSTTSQCLRRKVGAIATIPFPKGENEIVLGVNHANAYHHCDECTREDDCPALHAEVSCINSARPGQRSLDNLYVWAEVPCLGCLSYIKENSSISTIYCLHLDLYKTYYKRAANYYPLVELRKNYASKLGLTIVEITAL